MNTYRTNFENMRVPTLQTIYTGITHKREKLQAKMAEDMGRTGFYDILPRNFEILPIEKCSLHDIRLLEELDEKSFDVFWTIEKKKAEAKGTVKEFEAKFKFYSFMDCLTDEEQRRVYDKMESYIDSPTSHKIIQRLIVEPNFLEVVI
ncbi:MAG: hypothetical protein IJF83_05805 [Methanobrevibacter sp.]|nr:hypothetical protein [Methanobrevibacter sp.]